MPPAESFIERKRPIRAPALAATEWQLIERAQHHDVRLVNSRSTVLGVEIVRVLRLAAIHNFAARAVEAFLPSKRTGELQPGSHPVIELDLHRVIIGSAHGGQHVHTTKLRKS